MGSGDKAQLLLGGVQLGNVWIAVQPPLGVPGTSGHGPTGRSDV